MRRIPIPIMCRLATGSGSTAAFIDWRYFQRLSIPIWCSGPSGPETGSEETEGVYSHETALSLWELSDVNPSKLHITVPKHFRRNSKPPSILVLHYADVPPGDIEAAQGYKFTKPLRTILDVIEADSVSKDIIRQAIRQAFERGLINRKQISSAKMKDSVRKLFEAELRRGTQ